MTAPNVFGWLCFLFTKVQILAVVFDSLHTSLYDEIPSLLYFFLKLDQSWKSDVNIRPEFWWVITEWDN